MIAIHLNEPKAKMKREVHRAKVSDQMIDDLVQP